MNNEDETFKQLKKLTFDEVVNNILEISQQDVHSKEWDDIRAKHIEECGWTVAEFDHAFDTRIKTLDDWKVYKKRYGIIVV